MTVHDFMFGDEGKFVRESSLTPKQQEIWDKYQEAAAGGFEDAANYYKKILSDDPELYRQLFGSEIQQFNRETMPGIAEQFASMGSGGIDSSGFQQSAAAAGADLSERLATMRAQLKGQAATGMADLAKGTLTPTDYVSYQQPQQGFAEQVPGLAVQAGAAYMGAPIAAPGAVQKAGSTQPYKAI